MNLLLAALVATFSWTGGLRLEAESARRYGGAVDTARAGYSGTGYVATAPGDSIRFTFEADAGVYQFRLAYFNALRLAPYTVWIDGEKVAGSATTTRGVFAERSLGEFRLAASGTHTVVFAGRLDVDYLEVEAFAFAPPAPPPAALTDRDATPATRALYAFLLDEYGKHVLAGQQDLGEIAYIERVTGKTPAIGAFDLIEYSPSRIQYGANPGRAAESWLGWAGQDGIVALMWHWNAPTDLINTAPDRLWWRGFYTDATTFDFAAALADTTSERYALLLRDMDAIAAQLQKFQAANVPVLWRPLHEAAGGWFWWGSKGPEAFKKLWQLMYHRLVDVNGLHNLVWVYTHEPGAADWYPGDAYVDVVGRDVYASDPATLMRDAWSELQTLYGSRKPVALSESGTLPDLDAATDFGVWWSWFALWTGSSYIRAVPADHLTRVMTSERVLTRDELPDWRQYATATEAAATPAADALALYPNPTRGAARLRVVLPRAGRVQIAVFDALGRQVAVRTLGSQPAGPFETPLSEGLAAGVYLVRVVAGDFHARATLIVAP